MKPFWKGVHWGMGYPLATKRRRREEEEEEGNLCPSCGELWPCDYNYCPYCGSKLKKLFEG